VTLLTERLEDEQADQKELELQRKQREEERQRLDEEAREREQQVLRQLQRQEQVFHGIQSVCTCTCDWLCLLRSF